MKTITHQGHTFYQWQMGPSTFTAWPEIGARLMSWTLKLANGTNRNILYWPDEPDYSKPSKIRGGNPILFPFVARTFHEGKENTWKTPKGQVLPMPRHGFSREASFELIEVDDHGFAAKLLPTAADHEVYPFNYEFVVRYRFKDLSLVVDLELHNQDSQVIPWCAGHHFYFELPWHKGLTLADYRIEIPAKKAFHHGPTGKLEPSDHFQPLESCNFNEPDLIDRIHTKLKHNKVVFGPRSGEEDISIIVGQEKQPTPWTAVTTWTESSGKPPFYCVEPWMGPPSAPELDKGLHRVNPGEMELFRTEISFV